jgi:hypothetical protein
MEKHQSLRQNPPICNQLQTLQNHLKSFEMKDEEISHPDAKGTHTFQDGSEHSRVQECAQHTRLVEDEQCGDGKQ